MKKELKSGTLSADISADCRPTVCGVNVIAVLGYIYFDIYGQLKFIAQLSWA